MPTAIDLFCGCGGLSLGFQNAGFTILRAFDIWDKAINNYNLNFSHPAELQDINQLSPDYLKSFSPDVIIGGPPCQDYSSAGKQDETLGRANLTLRYTELGLFCTFSLVRHGECRSNLKVIHIAKSFGIVS